MRRRMVGCALVAAVMVCGLGRVGMGATVSVLNQLTADEEGVLAAAHGMVQLHTKKGAEGRAWTKSEFKTPLVITAVMQTDSNDIRLNYGSGMVIFDWEINEQELRFRDPRSGGDSGVPGQGAIPKNMWASIKWVIDDSGMTVSVNGKERGTLKGDYSKISGKVGISTYGKAVLTVKSLTVTSQGGRGGGAAVVDAAGDETFEGVDVAVSTSPPEGLKKSGESGGKADEHAVERPAYRGKQKALVKSLGEVTGMAVRVAADGEENGSALDIIGTVTADSRAGSEAGAGIAADVGPEMRTCFKEAVKAVQLRYPYWEPGHIDVSFGDKYIPHEGGSAGTAFSVLMLSMLEGFEIDPKCAVTGDVTVDWKVRPVGGITAKLRGAALDGCTAAAIPEGNELAFADMRLLYGEASMWNVQVFSIGHLQDAVGLLRTDRDAKVSESMTLFAGLREELGKDWRGTLKSSATTGTLKKILELTPNCLSAKYLQEMANGTAPRVISSSATIYGVVQALYPFKQLMKSGVDITPENLSLVTMATARKRIGALRPIAPAELQPLLNDALAYAEAISNVAYNRGDEGLINRKAEVFNARLAAVSSEPGFMDKLVREGY